MTTIGWHWKFPATRTCLWDGSPLGKSEELSLAGNGRIFVQLSVSALHRALGHARMGTLKTLDCYMIASAWIDNAEIIVVEINRFDPGRTDHRNKSLGLLPTSLMAGDIPIATQVVLDAPSGASYLSHNLHNLQKAIADLATNLTHPLSSLDPATFMSLRLHCACSEEGLVTVQCGCVLPSISYSATPIRSIPIVQTALARNLSGPLPISVLQGKYKHGFLTMDSCRKLLLLLHSDPKVPSLPLVGVWVSGVETDQHPVVWAACSSYAHSATLSDRVWGEGQKKTFLLLLYLKGMPQAHYMQCQVGHTPSMHQTPHVSCSMSSAEAKFQWMPDMKQIELELRTVAASSALHTLLESASMTTELQSLSSTEIKNENIPPHPQPSLLKPHMSDKLLPHLSPSPAPERVLRDSNLSVISSLSTEDCSFSRHQTQSSQHQQKASSEIHNTTVTTTASANSVAPSSSSIPCGSSVSSSIDRGSQSSVSDANCHGLVLPSQEERMGVVLAARCLNALQEGGFEHSELASTNLEEFVSRGMESVSRETSTISMATSMSRDTTAYSQDTSTMYLDLRSYVDSLSSSEGRSNMLKTPQPPKETSEEDSRASFSHLLRENEAEYYKLLLNQVLGQQKQQQDPGSKVMNPSCMDSGNWHPQSHSTSLQEHSKVQEPVDVGPKVKNVSETLRGNSNASSDLSLCLGNVVESMTAKSSSGVPASSGNDPSLNLHSILHSSSTSNGRSSERSPQDISLLSLPPSGINTMLLTAGLWGLDLSVDEDLHHADLIGKKYLHRLPNVASAGDSVRTGNSGLHQLPLDEASVNQTLALSTTMYQFLERHDIMHRDKPALAREMKDTRQIEGCVSRACSISSNPLPVSHHLPLAATPDHSSSKQNHNILDVEKTRALQKFT